MQLNNLTIKSEKKILSIFKDLKKEFLQAEPYDATCAKFYNLENKAMFSPIYNLIWQSQHSVMY